MRSILMLQFSAMVALDLSMAKFHYENLHSLPRETPAPFDEIFHMSKVEILHRPTPYNMPRPIYNAGMATLST
jgi:hypothetical protein